MVVQTGTKIKQRPNVPVRRDEKYFAESKEGNGKPLKEIITESKSLKPGRDFNWEHFGRCLW